MVKLETKVTYKLKCTFIIFVYFDIYIYIYIYTYIYDEYLNSSREYVPYIELSTKLFGHLQAVDWPCPELGAVGLVLIMDSVRQLVPEGTE